MKLFIEPGTTDHKQINAVVEHVFRHEYGKLVSMLVRMVGISKLEDVEDVVQDSLMAAMTGWAFRGVPENPTGWLVQVAKNKMVDSIRRRSAALKYFVPIDPAIHDSGYTFEIEKLVLPWEIGDSQLSMMFVCAHPGISKDSQITLMLKTLCGFSVREIANAFLTKDETIKKRLTRARNYFREHHVSLEAPTGHELTERRDAVLTSLYLLFNEGYKRTDSVDDRSSTDGLIDWDLCLEALRLALILSEQESTRSPEVLALVALMSLLSARFDTRTNENGAIILLSNQDRSKWNQELIKNGMEYFRRSEPDIHTSSYHLEAAIQSLHATAPTYEETDWPAILGLYRRLYAMKPSPVIAMHMSVSMCQVHGPDAAIELLTRIPLPNYYLYHALLGDAYLKVNRFEDAGSSFRRAIELTGNAREKALLQQRLAEIGAH